MRGPIPGRLVTGTSSAPELLCTRFAASASGEDQAPVAGRGVGQVPARRAQLLGTLRQLLPAARLILMTAYATPEVCASARALGATVLMKPFALEELQRVALECWPAGPCAYDARHRPFHATQLGLDSRS